jgi:CubicO group peptidase (beta-lactamase class C family)
MRAFIAAVLIVMCLAAVEICGQETPTPRVTLHMAALQGNVDAVREHIAAGSDLDAKDPWGSTPLIIAVTFDRTEVARALIEAGADLEIANREGSTPLHTAAFLCRAEIVEILLEHSASRQVRDDYGNSPFDVVAGPFSDVEKVYASLQQGLAPLGLKLDMARLRTMRPRIAEMLRARPDELDAVDFAPVKRDDWKVATPAELGMDPHLIAELYLDAASVPKLYSVLIVRDGRLIAERYFGESSIDHTTRLCSVTKSYTSALTGIALEQGYLSSVDQKMIDFFPEIAGKITDPRKKQITIRHLLQMRSGYPWEEIDPEHWNGLLSGHYPPLIEAFPLLGEPGSQFNYSNLSSNWLGIIVARACGTNLRSFAQEHLVSPIGAEAGEWGTDAEGHNNGCGNLHMTARDAAKFGLLYLNGGRWNGRQVIPAEWVADSLKNYSDDAWIAHDRLDHLGTYFRDLGYGYQWWSAQVGEHDVDYAAGHGGQFIILLHDLDMVIVATSHPFFLQHDSEAWKHEKSTINLVGKFIRSLPKE